MSVPQCFYKTGEAINKCCLVVYRYTYPSEKWWSSSVGMMIIPNMMGKSSSECSSHHHPVVFFKKWLKKWVFPFKMGGSFHEKNGDFPPTRVDAGCAWLRMAHGAGGWVSGSTQPRTQALARRAFGTSKRHSSGPTLVIPWWFQWWSMDIHSTNYPLVMSTVCYWKWP